MGIVNHQPDHPEVRDRAAERQGDRCDISPPVRVIDLSDYRQAHKFIYGTELTVGQDEVLIGNEIFKVDELAKAHNENPQPASHPFKPHHYLVQKALDDVTAFYKLHPDRKPLTGKAVPT